jgi:hypothetical protein
MIRRHRDDGRTIYEFMDLFLVRCPKCHRCAQVIPRQKEKADIFDPRRLTCFSCGFNKDWSGNVIGGRSGDPYFHRPLWLQIPCCGHTLWANNLDYLNYLEDYIRATLRERGSQEAYRLRRNKTLVSSLPGWMKSAKNREEVLKKIALLRTKLEERSSDRRWKRGETGFTLRPVSPWLASF